MRYLRGNASHRNGQLFDKEHFTTLVTRMLLRHGLRYHDIVEFPLGDRNGSTLPIILVDDGEQGVTASFSAMVWARTMLYSGFSQKTIYAKIKAVARFYDFCFIGQKDLAHALPIEKLQRYANLRLYGSETMDGLCWKAVRLQTVRDEIRHISEYSKFCVDSFGDIPINKYERKYISEMESLRKFEIKKKTTLLAHLYPHLKRKSERQGDKLFDGIAPSWNISKRNSRGRNSAPKIISVDEIVKLVNAASNPRDKLIVLIMAFGGPRVSEILNLFLQDMRVTINGDLHVYLTHPVEAKMEWMGCDGKLYTGKRTEYLRDIYKLTARPLLASKDPFYAGWKALLIEDADNMKSNIYWLDKMVSRYAARLHIEYIKTIRNNPAISHPYYFVSLCGDSYGEPMKCQAVRSLLKRLCKKANVKEISPHVMRHCYGTIASELGIRREVIQYMMHHASPESQDRYRHLSSKYITQHISDAVSDGMKNIGGLFLDE